MRYTLLSSPLGPRVCIILSFVSPPPAFVGFCEHLAVRVCTGSLFVLEPGNGIQCQDIRRSGSLSSGRVNSREDCFRAL